MQWGKTIKDEHIDVEPVNIEKGEKNIQKQLEKRECSIEKEKQGGCTFKL